MRPSRWRRWLRSTSVSSMRRRYGRRFARPQVAEKSGPGFQMQRSGRLEAKRVTIGEDMEEDCTHSSRITDHETAPIGPRTSSPAIASQATLAADPPAPPRRFGRCIGSNAAAGTAAARGGRSQVRRRRSREYHAGNGPGAGRDFDGQFHDRAPPGARAPSRWPTS